MFFLKAQDYFINKILTKLYFNDIYFIWLPFRKQNTMAKDDKTYVVNEQTLDMYMGAQMSVSPHYDAKTYLGQSSFLIEKQSASFLTDYVNGEISLSEKAEQMMPDFLHI